LGTVHKSMPKKQVKEILNLLADTYPDAHCELDFTNPFQLLVATILSAQCTDKRVNVVTERLFQKYPTPQQILELKQEGLEAEIKECGLFRNKAKNILATCKVLLDKYGGEVPGSLEELVALPGVGRKTANVVGSNAFGIPAIAVDTHVFRVANRLGLANSDNVEKVEKQLQGAIPQDMWIAAHHWLIWHGRRVCEARRPKCEICPLQQNCKYAKT
jgi:endonuclease III